MADEERPFRDVWDENLTALLLKVMEVRMVLRCRCCLPETTNLDDLVEQIFSEIRVRGQFNG
jgi:hypothetical protein